LSADRHTGARLAPHGAAREKNMSTEISYGDRKAALDALSGVQDAVWFCILSSAKAINRVMASTVLDDPTPNGVLDQAIVAELARFGDGPMPD
jgi:hypothetical protein